MTDTRAPTQKPRPLSEDVMALIGTINAFTGVLRRETDALQKLDFQTVDLLQQDKMDLSRTYRTHVQALCARKDEIPALDAGLRERFISVRAAFTTLLADNMRALESAKDGARRLSERILEIARQSVVDEVHTHYSAKGQTAAYKSAGAALSIDQSL